MNAAIDNSHNDIDLDRLQAYLCAHIPGFVGPIEIQRFPGGQSNPTYKLTTPGGVYVMRCKPAPAARLLPSAHAIEREYRLQSALTGSAVPVAPMYCLCEDENIIGRAFYVMAFVEGRILWEQSLPGLSPDARAAIYDEMNRVIAALHAVDPAAVGLADYGKAGNFFARQIDRWTRQYRASQTGTIAAMEQLIEWLPQHIPVEETPQVAIVHGDFRLDNLIFHPSEPRVLAVIDWELSTLGHPLADFAYHVMSWHIPPAQFRGLGGLDLAALGIPAEADYVAAYLRRTGLTMAGDWNFYLAYNLFRSAGILQGIAKRVQDGTAAGAQAEAIGRGAQPLAELGWQFAQRVR
jgi:aminoglycoside phosphotransferase (APT) family kinase protein